MEQLQPIVDEYKDGDDTPLDTDEGEGLIKILRAKLNFSEGNISEEEYEEILG